MSKIARSASFAARFAVFRTLAVTIGLIVRFGANGATEQIADFAAPTLSSLLIVPARSGRYLNHRRAVVVAHPWERYCPGADRSETGAGARHG